MSAVVSTSALKASPGIPSGPAALPFFIFLMAQMISSLIGGSQSMSMSISASAMSGGFSGAGLLRSPSNVPPISLIVVQSLMFCPCLSLTGWSGLL